VLRRARSGDLDPYAWCAEALDGHAAVLDLACGSAPLVELLPAGAWVGIDASEAELTTARARGPVPVVRGRAERLPIAAGAVGAVACTMALMVVQPLDGVLAELGRVLGRGAPVVALLPSRGPLSVRDRARYARLMAALRQKVFTFPNDRALHDVDAALARHGLLIRSDERRRFVLDVVDDAVADAYIRSMYLPGVSPARAAAASRVARRWVGSQLGLPLRRIIATRA
jgi:SAM-dependent methyltransferase